MASSHIIDTLIEEQQWEQVRQHLMVHPEEAARMVNPSLGWTKLHWLCSMGSTPASLVDLVASLYPDAITMADNRYGDTPLHLACRNAQVTAQKTKFLLHHLERHQRKQQESLPESTDGPTIINEENDSQDKLDPEARSSSSPPLSSPPIVLHGVLLRNRFGGTALHSACNHNALLEVLMDLVRANPRLPSVTTFDGIHPVSALYTSYIQTITGHMAVARRLKGEEVTGSSHFQRFWAKVVFLSTAAVVVQNPPVPPVTDPTTTNRVHTPDRSRLVLHGLLRTSSMLVNFYKLALKHDPDLARVGDENGNYALHLLVNRRPYRLKEREAMEATLDAATLVAHVRNHAGDLPLLAAIRNKIPWSKGLDLLVQRAPTTVQRRDISTNLLPFQLAASVGGKVALDNTYELLCIQPDLLFLNTESSQ